jgi:membrane carboxypeptidase/penicillin-binding protein PbpC
VAKRAVLRLSYFIATFPLLLFSKLAFIFNLWGFKNDAIKCLEVASKYDTVKLPKELLVTLEIAEDHRHHLHFGIDQIALCRAILCTLKGSVQGASTIEQQFVRVVINKYERTVRRKLFEQLLAVHVSSLLNKESIATAYLCIAYYGQSKLGTLRLKNTVDIAFNEFKYSDAISIVTRLKYPEPSIKNNWWLSKFESRNKHLAVKINTANKLINKDKKQFAVFVPQHFSKQFFACY